MEYTAQLLLALIFIIVAILLVVKVRNTTVPGYDKQQCMMSVVANARFKVPIIRSEMSGGLLDTDIKCPTRYVTVYTDKIISETSKGDKIEIPIECGKTGFMGLASGGIIEKKEGKEDEYKTSLGCFINTTNRLMANLMFDCWDQFGGGKIAVFGETSTERRCVICSRVEFDRSVQELSQTDDFKELKSDMKFNDYLKESSPKQHDISYYEFILDDADIRSVWPVYEYGYEKPMAVLFMNEYEQKISERLKEEGSMIYQCAKGWFLINTKLSAEKPCELGEALNLDHDPELINQNTLVQYDQIKDAGCAVLR